jgi:hypothetical protein
MAVPAAQGRDCFRRTIQRVSTLAGGQPSDSKSGIEAVIGSRSSSASTTGPKTPLYKLSANGASQHPRAKRANRERPCLSQPDVVPARPVQREQCIGTTGQSAAEIDTGFHRAERVARRAVCQLPIAFVSEYALGAQPEVHEAGAAVAPARNKVGRPGAEPLGEDIPETADFDPPLALKISMPNVLGTIVETTLVKWGETLDWQLDGKAAESGGSAIADEVIGMPLSLLGSCWFSMYPSCHWIPGQEGCSNGDKARSIGPPDRTGAK